MNGLLLAAAQPTVEYSDITVAALGLGTVFFGLVCIIFICTVFGKIFANTSKKAAAAPAQAPAPQSELSAEEKGAVIAAVSAVIAEELGTDVSALRIHSFKKI